MPRTMHNSFGTHLSGEVLTTCLCLQITKKTGGILYFTDLPVDFVFLSQTYKGGNLSVKIGNVDAVADLDETSLQIDGALIASGITNTDLLAGAFDNAPIMLYKVNWQDSTQYTVLFSGFLGKVQFAENQFRTTSKNLSYMTSRTIGTVYTPSCPQKLGDARCTVDVSLYTGLGTVVSATSRKQFTATITDSNQGSSIEADGWYTQGLLTWVTGSNAGFGEDVCTHTFSTNHTIQLELAMSYAISTGDTFTVVVGCQKRKIEDCKTKFNNIINFRGYAELPGRDAVSQTPDLQFND